MVWLLEFSTNVSNTFFSLFPIFLYRKGYFSVIPIDEFFAVSRVATMCIINETLNVEKIQGARKNKTLTSIFKELAFLKYEFHFGR